jgi:hypothetical protein
MKVRLHLLENRPWLARVLFSFTLTVVMALCVRGSYARVRSTGQCNSALVVYRLAFGSPRSFADVD